MKLQCPICGNDMKPYDIEYLHKDCYNELHWCKPCKAFATIEVRFGVPNMIFWSYQKDVYETSVTVLR